MSSAPPLSPTDLPSGRDCARVALLAFGAALLARAAFGAWVLLGAGTSYTTFLLDSREYLDLAAALLDDHAFPSVLRVPGYPASVAALYAVFGRHVEAILVAQWLLGAGTAAVLALALARLTGDLWAARLGGLFVALEPSSVEHSSLVMSETLFTALLVTGVYLLLRFAREGRPWRLAASAAFIAAAMLTRSAGSPLPFLLGACLAVFATPGRRRLGPAAAFVAGCLLLLAPWYAANYHRHGRWFLTTNEDLSAFDWDAPAALLFESEGRLVLLERDRPRGVAPPDFFDNLLLKWRAPLREEAGDLLAPDEEARYVCRKDARRCGALGKIGFRTLLKHPAGAAVTHLAGAAGIVVPLAPSVSGRMPGGLRLGARVLAWALFALFCAGAAFAASRMRRDAGARTAYGAMLLLIAYFALLPGIRARPRFGVPIAPFVCALAALGARSAAAFARRRASS